jgi:hypothetical protein
VAVVINGIGVAYFALFHKIKKANKTLHATPISF